MEREFFLFIGDKSIMLLRIQNDKVNHITGFIVSIIIC